MVRSGISRKKKGGKSKTVKAGSTRALFPVSSCSQVVSGDADGSVANEIKKPSLRTLQQEKKSINNKLYYQKKKQLKAKAKVDELKIEVSQGLERQALLETLAKKEVNITQKANTSAAKMMTKLSGSRRKLGVANEQLKDEKSKTRRKSIEVAKCLQKKLDEKDEAHAKQMSKEARRHADDTRKEVSVLFKKLRKESKKIVELEDQLKTQDAYAQKSATELESNHQSTLQSQAKQLTSEHDVASIMLESKLKRQHKLKEIESVKTIGTMKKGMRNLELKVAAAKAGKEKAEQEMISTEERVSVKVKEGVTAAKAKERSHFSRVLAKEAVKLTSLKVKLESSKSAQKTILNATVSYTKLYTYAKTYQS